MKSTTEEKKIWSQDNNSGESMYAIAKCDCCFRSFLVNHIICFYMQILAG